MSEESIRQELKIIQDEIQRKLTRIDEMHSELSDLEEQADELLESLYEIKEKSHEKELKKGCE